MSSTQASVAVHEVADEVTRGVIGHRHEQGVPHDGTSKQAPIGVRGYRLVTPFTALPFPPGYVLQPG
jgi:hypothetical protein